MPVGHLISSLDKCLLRSSVHLIELFGFLLLSHMGYLHILVLALYQIYDLETFFLFSGFPFILLTVS